MSPEKFITRYSSALATQQWINVEPLIHTNACVTFSNGAVHKGITELKQAYERNFSLIKNEVYSIDNIHWVKQTETMAVYLFDFSWKGFIDNKPAGGSGCGTAVLINEVDGWKLLAEHLGPAK